MTVDAAAGEAVGSLARRLYGNGCRVSSYDRLTERVSSVARLRLSGAPIASAIAKHLPRPAHSNEAMIVDDPEFANELLCYRFLQGIGLDGAVAPALLGFDSAGVLLLADMGDAGAQPQRGFDYLVPALAKALARLHGSTAGRAADYDVLRYASGLGTRQDDWRKYGIPGTVRLFHAGAALCLSFENRQQRDIGALAKDLAQVEAMIAAPGAHLALVHDDLANARQTFDAGEQLYFLDFEQAKFSHALLDFAKPMIGKFEVDDRINVTRWQCPGFPPELPAQYRAVMLDEFGQSFPDGEWNVQLAASLIFGALGLVGRMAAWDPRRVLKGTPRQNVNAVLHRLSVLLAEQDVFAATRAFLDDYLEDLLTPCVALV